MTQPGRPTVSPGGMQTGKAVLVIVVVVIVGWVVLRHGTSSPHASAPTTTRPVSSTTAAPSTTTVPLVAPANIKLQVLNGVLTGSLAGEWSAKLKANPGYDTLAPLNATAKVAQSEIYIVTPGFQREANALAVAVGLPVTAVNVTVPPPASAPVPAASRTTANLILVIGPDLASSA
jgi:hypothetical protein